MLNTPGVGGLSGVVRVLREWQYDGAPVQLHPGDLGWYWRFGAEETAAAVRTWSRDGRMLAVGLLDGPTVLRLSLAPDAQHDEQLARQILADVDQPASDVLPEGEVSVEARSAERLREFLLEDGWEPGESWTPLRRDLAPPLEDCGVRTAVVTPDQASLRTAVQRAAFDGSSFTDERWRVMAAGLPYAEARCLVAFDEGDNAVAAATVWAAGPGRPGLLEPMGVHRGHRGRGYGRAISLAGADALRELGSSSAIVCTRSSNLGAVATYRSAGFQPLAEARDLQRPI
ncbi:MAG TPA: GNAT family N-acetyltransferase [Solirubrobacteraceae bacterium]|nr:GNAT family N-acetyltransferase [Solirubrobacteraceae bacterium]